MCRECIHNVCCICSVINACQSRTYREVGRSLNALIYLIRIVTDKVDKGLCRINLSLVAVIEDTKAPDTTAKFCLAVIGREQHRDDRIAVVCLACFAVVGIGLLCSIPAQGHCQCAVTE